MSTQKVAAQLASIVQPASCLAFVPVAAHFDLFGHLVRMGKPASSDEVTAACNAEIRKRARGEPELCEWSRSSNSSWAMATILTEAGTKLAEDTLFIMAGLGLIDSVAEGIFNANDVTKIMVQKPGAQEGAFHFTTEALLAAAFTYPRLKDTNFEYPFKEADGPMQHAYKLLGNEKLSQMHTYAIMAHEGRMPSFNQFMFDKYGFSNKLPGHIKDYGYDLDAVMAGIPDEKAKVVDIGGGNGNTILDFKEAYPQLGPNDLIVQDCYANVDSLPGITVMKWDFKDTTPQPVHGAGVYILQHILHNNPDLQAVAILQKVAKAMTADSRLFVVEFTKHTGLASVHASMISLYGGRERSSVEYKQMAELAGLEVTFEGYRFYDECVVEMRKKT